MADLLFRISVTIGPCGLSKRYLQSSACPTLTNCCDHQEFYDRSTHCEYDEGYIVFRLHNDYKVWRRRTDVLDIPEGAWPSGSQNKPDDEMIKGSRTAEDQYFDASCGRDPNHLRGQFIPWVRLSIPEPVRGLKLVRRILLVLGDQMVFLYDIEKAELQQAIEVDDVHPRVAHYVDLSEHHILNACALRVDVYDRETGSLLLSIPAGTQPWDCYARPENQWGCVEQTLDHGELSFQQVLHPSLDDRVDYFCAGA